MQTKLAQARVEIKDDDKGTVDLVFATYNVVDKDGDVQMPGTFEDGAKAAVSAYGHTSWEGKLPVGVATLHTAGRKEARASARFFMDTQHGADTFRTVKELHKNGLGDWSYGFDVLKHSFGEFPPDGGPSARRVRFLERQKVHEISPVLIGAGVNTRTLAAKARKNTNDGEGDAVFHGAIRPHETATTDEPWTASDVKSTLDWSVSDLRATHAWYDATQDPESKAAYAFRHHDGPGDPANVRACMLGIAALNMGTTAVPDAAKQAVYDHLAGHLRDADVWVPELVADPADRSTVKANDAALMVLAELGGVVDHFADVGASRALKGRHMTKANQTLLGWVREELSRLDGLLGAPTDLEGFDPDHELARFVQASRRL